MELITADTTLKSHSNKEFGDPKKFTLKKNIELTRAVVRPKDEGQVSTH